MLRKCINSIKCIRFNKLSLKIVRDKVLFYFLTISKQRTTQKVFDHKEAYLYGFNHSYLIGTSICHKNYLLTILEYRYLFISSSNSSVSFFCNYEENTVFLLTIFSSFRMFNVKLTKSLFSIVFQNVSKINSFYNKLLFKYKRILTFTCTK